MQAFILWHLNIHGVVSSFCLIRSISPKNCTSRCTKIPYIKCQPHLKSSFFAEMNHLPMSIRLPNDFSAAFSLQNTFFLPPLGGNLLSDPSKPLARSSIAPQRLRSARRGHSSTGSTCCPPWLEQRVGHAPSAECVGTGGWHHLDALYIKGFNPTSGSGKNDLFSGCLSSRI